MQTNQKLVSLPYDKFFPIWKRNFIQGTPREKVALNLLDDLTTKRGIKEVAGRLMIQLTVPELKYLKKLYEEI